MERIRAYDVREQCDIGVLRAFSENGKIYLEETDTGILAALNEKEICAPRKPGKMSRTERIFGSKDKWNIPASQPEPDEDQGPYKGFLMIRCEECGEVRAFSAKQEIYGFRCKCGHETPLEKLKPMFMHCKCGKDFRYRTNLQDEKFTYNCMNCGAPVDIKINSRKTAYVTVGERRK